MAVTKPKQCSYESIVQESYVENPNDPNASAQSVVVENTSSNPVQVTFATLTATQQHVNGTVVNAGTPVTVTPPSGNIKAFILQNPPVGPNLNSSTKVLLVSFDNGVNYFTVPNGAIYVAEEIDEANITIDATKDNTNFEIVLEYA